MTAATSAVLFRSESKGSGSHANNALKVIGIRPIAPVLNKVHMKVSEHEMLSFSERKEITKNDNSLVVFLLSKVVENEFLHTV